MKKAFKLFALMAVAMGAMMITSCEKEEGTTNNGPSGIGGGSGGGSTSTTIVCNTFATPQTISQEGSVTIEGSELMISAYDGTALLEAYGGVDILTTPGANDYDKVICLQGNEEIGSNGHFTSDNSADLYTESSYTAWGNKTGYAGISFKKNGKTVYGWVKLSVNTANTTVTVYGYAYEGTAGKSIKAGATK